MYRKALFTTLLGTALLTNGVEAGRGNGSPNDPRIDATKVDSQQTLLTIQGDHFGSSMPSVVMGRWQLKVKTHSNQEIVAELPKGVSGNSYRMQVISGAPANASSEPFFTTLFTASNP